MVEEKEKDKFPEFSLYDYYMLTNKRNVLISYKGPVTDVILAEISRDIRAKLSANPQIGRKIFAVFMELAQNILYYSAEKINFGGRNDSVGTILITQNVETETYTFACGNLVEVEYIKDLIESCNIINSMDREALREYKRQQRSAPQKERSKGAGIGLIQVALTTDSPLHAEYKQVNEKYVFFSLAVDIF
ncbi:MAG: SiaB family protein kinase [Microscillaceae bacterium]|nr:SiaB family protein kinase [Microscillaceae bacterium]MDW8460655.1 SiaB family protein kinase [Cytophagales bacterium]